MDAYNRLAIGQESENLACAFLLKKGLHLLHQNFRCKLGEIDLIMQDKEHVVFVEVRSRSNKNYGNPLESITRAKQQKIIKSAMLFLQIKKWFNRVSCRFDVVAISLETNDRQIEWIKNAFSSDRR